MNLISVSLIKSSVAWDAMSYVTFGAPLGLLEAGNDDKGFLETSSRSLDYFAPVTNSFFS